MKITLHISILPGTSKVRIGHVSASFSVCGSWVSLRNQAAKIHCGPWILPPEMWGRVAPFQMPRTIHSRCAVTSMLWGSVTVFLHSSNVNGRYELIVSDSERSSRMTVIDQLLPSYLTNIEPVVIMDNEAYPCIRLVFPLPDGPPEIIIINQRWETLYEYALLCSSSDWRRASTIKLLRTRRLRTWRSHRSS